ncbi:MAG: ADP-ribosylglycohydrolase family protein, partial [Gammaproteobacteria bacterium]|nr:ADP-ribosylglycohydrolase family protein [Gammaproteobacteria bacterium]
IAAHESVPTAIFVFLNNASSIQDAVTAAIELGGDTDTIASMTGALAGAHLGLSAIPDRWLRRVEGVQRLIEIADQLFSLSARKGPGTKGF